MVEFVHWLLKTTNLLNASCLQQVLQRCVNSFPSFTVTHIFALQTFLAYLVVLQRARVGCTVLPVLLVLAHTKKAPKANVHLLGQSYICKTTLEKKMIVVAFLAGTYICKNKVMIHSGHILCLLLGSIQVCHIFFLQNSINDILFLLIHFCSTVY